MSNVRDLRSALSAMLTEQRGLSSSQEAAIEAMLSISSDLNENLTVSSLKLSASGRKAHPPKNRLPAVNEHLSALRAAGTDRNAFELAVSALLSDKLIRTSELIDVANAYSGRKLKSKSNRAEAEAAIRQTFSRESWQQEAYRRIEKLTAAE